MYVKPYKEHRSADEQLSNMAFFANQFGSRIAYFYVECTLKLRWRCDEEYSNIYGILSVIQNCIGWTSALEIRIVCHYIIRIFAF